jgi:hypothetical protein
MGSFPLVGLFLRMYCLLKKASMTDMDAAEELKLTYRFE